MARPVKKKSDVVDAALTLFMQKGIKATTTRDIALRAGVSEGTIYRHFESKEHLAREIFEQNLNVLWRFLKARFQNRRQADELLEAFIRGYFDFARRYYRRYIFLAAAQQTELLRLSRYRMKPKKMLAKILMLGQSQGAFQQMDTNLAAAMIMGTITQTIFYLKNGLIAVNFDEVVDEVVLACLRIVQHKIL